ncbi:MAG TPA: YceI family protein [Steroidobacteraceae bacterium]|nr:YceI family protein [Steroidobacteraceae bacterium]
MNLFKLTLSLALLTACATTTALAASSTYRFDPGHSFVRFGYGHFGFSHQQSQFDKVSGSLTFDPAARSGSADVVIDISSVDTGSSALNERLQGADFFDAAKFPTATFRSTSIRFEGDEPVAIEGNLTIKGITHPVTLTITHFKHGTNMMKRDAIGADATTTVKRSDFDLAEYVPMVDDSVVLNVDFEAAAAPAG